MNINYDFFDEFKALDNLMTKEAGHSVSLLAFCKQKHAFHTSSEEAAIFPFKNLQKCSTFP